MGSVAFVGLLFSMLSIRLMAAAESAQVIVAGAIGHQLQNRVVAMTMGTRKFLLMRVGIAFFSRASWLIFTVEGMYVEKVVQGAALAMLKTTITSNRVRIAAATTARQTGRAARRLKSAVRGPGTPGAPAS